METRKMCSGHLALGSSGFSLLPGEITDSLRGHLQGWGLIMMVARGTSRMHTDLRGSQVPLLPCPVLCSISPSIPGISLASWLCAGQKENINSTLQMALSFSSFARIDSLQASLSSACCVGHLVCVCNMLMIDCIFCHV